MHDVIRKNLHLFIVLFTLLFNVQVGLTHDVAHVCHESDNQNIDNDENCLLKNNVTKSTDLSKKFHPDISNENQFHDNYYLSTQLAYRFVAYQSQAP